MEIGFCAAMCLGVMVADGAAAPPAANSAAKAPHGTKVVSGIEAVRLLCSRREYAQAEQYAYRMLWEDIAQPEVLDWLVRALDSQGKREEAGVFNTLLLRVLAESATGTNVARYKTLAVRRQPALDQEFQRLQARYAETASGKHFSSPEEVHDLWMTQVKADLAPLHGLYAWTLVGGRKDAKPDWIHNRQGQMHRSGLKYVKEVDGRQGVLFAIPLKTEHRRSQQLGHPPQIKITNLGKGKFLRVGTEAYHFPFLLKVYVRKEEVFSRTIGEKAWSDLKIDLKDAAALPEEVTLELVIPPEQRWAEGAWFDYLDFFDD
jgi:hypothetical protein